MKFRNCSKEWTGNKNRQKSIENIEEKLRRKKEKKKIEFSSIIFYIHS